MAQMHVPILVDRDDIKDHMAKSDIVEVVRCKDCKYSEHWYRDKSRCFLWAEEGIDVFDDGFCNYATLPEPYKGEQE